MAVFICLAAWNGQASEPDTIAKQIKEYPRLKEKLEEMNIKNNILSNQEIAIIRSSISCTDFKKN